MKKLLLVMSFCISPLISFADEISTNLMIMNNANAQQFPDIWSRFRAGFKLDHSQTSRVKYYEKLYTKNPKSFNKLMSSAIPYLYFLLNEVERNGLPAELALIPGVESSYDPLAKNPGDAYAGMWQFVPVTGKRFNMIQNPTIDERRDLVKSTRAALNYFNYLHIMFKQWDVAIGAYNWGEGGMYRAVLNSGMPLGQVNYSELQLRQITADYVPRVIALASIIENPSKFGVTLDNVPNEPYFALIVPAANTSVADISRLSNIDNKTFTKLNGQYKDNNYRLSASNDILLPINNQSIYYANVGQAIVIANGIQLANNGVKPVVNADNNIKPASFVTTSAESATATNVISGDASTQASTKTGSTDSAATTTTQTAHEEDLNNLLDTLDGPNKTTKAANASVAAGAASTTTVALTTEDNVVKYTVNPGDTLYSIAKKFKADINQIKEDNNIPGNSLSAGQVLNIKTNSAIASSTM